MYIYGLDRSWETSSGSEKFETVFLFHQMASEMYFFIMSYLETLFPRTELLVIQSMPLPIPNGELSGGFSVLLFCLAPKAVKPL